MFKCKFSIQIVVESLLIISFHLFFVLSNKHAVHLMKIDEKPFQFGFSMNDLLSTEILIREEKEIGREMKNESVKPMEIFSTLSTQIKLKAESYNSCKYRVDAQRHFIWNISIE